MLIDKIVFELRNGGVMVILESSAEKIVLEKSLVTYKDEMSCKIL